MNRLTIACRATEQRHVAWKGALVGAALLSAVTGCAGAHSAAISVAASTMLTTDANALASVADTGTAAELSVAAAKMRADVLALEATGGVSSARAAAVLGQVQRIIADAAIIPTVSTPAPASTLLQSPNTAAPGSGRGPKKGGTPPGKGKPHG